MAEPYVIFIHKRDTIHCLLCVLIAGLSNLLFLTFFSDWHELYVKSQSDLKVKLTAIYKTVKEEKEAHDAKLAEMNVLKKKILFLSLFSLHFIFYLIVHHIF